MQSDLRRRCIDVLSVKSTKEFTRQISSFAHSLGYDRVSAVVVTEHSGCLTEFQTVTNAPPEFLEDFYDLEKARRDPVSQHCKHRSNPIVWDRETYTACNLGDFWEYQASFGYQTGIAFAMHFPRGRHF